MGKIKNERSCYDSMRAAVQQTQIRGGFIQEFLNVDNKRQMLPAIWEKRAKKYGEGKFRRKNPV